MRVCHRVSTTLWTLSVTLLAVLIIGPPCTAQFLPTYAIIKDQDSEERVLLVSGTMLYDSAKYAIEFIIDPQTMTGEDGTLWSLEDPIRVEVVRTGTRVETELVRIPGLTARNAYEWTTNHINPVCEDPTLTANECYVSCLVGQEVQRTTLKHNTTDYQFYEVAGSRVLTPHTNLEVRATQGATTAVLTLSTDAVFEGQIPAIKGEIISTVFNMLSSSNGLDGSITTKYIVASDTPVAGEDPFFTVPRQAVGSSVANQVGMPLSAFRSSYYCGQPVGQTTKTAHNGSPYDQFSTYRQETLAKTFDCHYWSEYSDLDPDYTTLAFECEQSSIEVNVLLKLNAQSFRLTSLYGEPDVLAAGILPFPVDAVVVELFLDVVNRASQSAVIQVRPVECIAQGNATGDSTVSSIVGVKEHGFDRFETHRFLFVISSDIVVDQSGYCRVEIYQHGRLYAEHRVDFDATQFNYSPTQTVPETEETCVAPNRLASRHGRVYCVKPCTKDQKYSESDRICQPDNCVVKYAGARDYYNIETNLCEAIRTCDAQSTYDRTENKCHRNTTTPATPTPTPLVPSSPGSEPVEYPGGDDSPVEYPRSDPDVLPIDCGDHGTPSKFNLSCVCDDGFVPDSLLPQCVSADIATKVDIAGHSGEATGSSSQWLTVVAWIGLVLVVVAIIACCCYKCRGNKGVTKEIVLEESDTESEVSDTEGNDHQSQRVQHLNHADIMLSRRWSRPDAMQAAQVARGGVQRHQEGLLGMAV